MRVVSFLCKENYIDYSAWRGQVAFKGKTRHEEHYWVRIGRGYVIDMNLNMFMGPLHGAPKGAFDPAEYIGLEYIAKQEIPIGIDALSFGIYTGIPAEAYPPACHFAKNQKPSATEQP